MINVPLVEAVVKSQLSGVFPSDVEWRVQHLTRNQTQKSERFARTELVTEKPNSLLQIPGVIYTPSRQR
jgi:hypothetical protein